MSRQYSEETMNEDSSAESGVSRTRRTYLKALGAVAGAAVGLRTGTGSTAAQSAEAIYQGVAETAIVVGDGISVAEQNYRRDVILAFGPPKQGGLSETNPFHLFVGPANRNETGLPGHYEIHSAALVGTDLFQYWELRSGDGAFEGTLTDPHDAEALVWNVVNVERALVPGRSSLGVVTTTLGMGAGTRLVGAVTEDTADVRLQGETIDRFTRFSSVISAARLA
ncbi:hypothetical protein [Halogeometricum luteum]|uniref:Twin-arginine translocation signal domain-containing protein n=1 Tax=Halogeometricum luteum TaxID=2950537 RepID=A0ABU2G2E3_9EURY|nr:hypothetical protein [Halogeometricum sp. S3BR5-2]MDS0294478.1 hypothetical protein [Halogeometricum sp. S3BR5-2]